MNKQNNKPISVDQLLNIYKVDIINSAAKRLTYFHLPHYKSYGFKKNSINVGVLYDFILKSYEMKDNAKISKFGQYLAKRNFGSDFNPFEIQAAFNIMEENIWQLIIDKLRPSDPSHSVKLITTIISIGKESIAIDNAVSIATKYRFNIDNVALNIGIECM